MTTVAQTVAGTKLYISAGLPATYDAAGFGALTYTVVAEVIDIGEIGKTYDLVAHTPIGDRKKYKLKGGYDSGQLPLQLAKATLANSDAGQALLLAASNSDADYSFKITFQDLTDSFFTGKTMSFKTKIGSLNSLLGATANVELTSDIVETV